MKARDSKKTVVGFDFGTCNSAASVLDEAGQPKPIKTAENEYITPSVACFLDNGDVIIGREAKNSAAALPDSVVREVKRQIGKTDGDGKSIAVFVDKKGKVWTAEELAALVLKKMKNDTETITGMPVGPAVVTVPAYYKDSEIRATINAARIAGLDILDTVPEPTAAALFYGLAKKGQGIQHYMVVDLGGGTLDVTIIRAEDGNVETIATDGERNLGGVDFDLRILARIEKETQKKGAKLDPATDPATCQEVRDKAESLKHSLSVRLEAIFNANVQGKQISFTYTRQEFEQDTRDLLERMGERVRAALKAAEGKGVQPSDISDTLLVGGATRMPMVGEHIAQIMGKPPKRDADPDLVVSMGGAMAAAQMLKQDGKKVFAGNGTEIKALPPGSFVNVASHALGCAAFNQTKTEKSFAPIIDKDTQLPAKGFQRFRLLEDWQTVACVEVYVGQAELPLEKCLHIGDVELTGLPPGPTHEERITVTYEYSRSGIVRVNVEDDKSGKSTHGEIKHQLGMTEDDIKAAAKRVAKVNLGV